jgi:hypothetical protein
MIEATCHCGNVRIMVPEPAPDTLTSCNCSICRRTGGLWAYYDPANVNVTGETVSYVQGDRMLEMRHCGTCGCITHWTPVDSAGKRMGVNARMMAPEIVAAARIRHLDGADTWEWLD